MEDTTFYIILGIEGVLALLFGLRILYLKFFDNRLRAVMFYPTKEITITIKKCREDIFNIEDSVTKRKETYTLNKEYIYYKDGHIPYAFFWNNIPIPINMLNNPIIPKNEELKIKKHLNEINSIIKKYDMTQFKVNIPSKKFNDSIEIETAETFFRLLNANFTLNLLKPPKEFKEAIKWTMIFIMIGIGILLLLHFTGQIDLIKILGITPKGG